MDHLQEDTRVQQTPLFTGKRYRLNGFDKFCAVLAFAIGVAFLLLGVFGTFLGCNAHFTLPPVLGVLPAFAGWGIVKPIVVAWKNKQDK